MILLHVFTKTNTGTREFLYMSDASIAWGLQPMNSVKEWLLSHKDIHIRILNCCDITLEGGGTNL